MIHQTRHSFHVDLDVELTSDQLAVLASSISCEVMNLLRNADVYVDHRSSPCSEVQVSHVWTL